MSATPTQTPTQLTGVPQYLEYAQMALPLFGQLLGMIEQLLAQTGHATDAHPVLNDAKAQLAHLNTHVAGVAAAAASSPAAS